MPHRGEYIDAGLHSLLTDARENLLKPLCTTFYLAQRQGRMGV